MSAVVARGLSKRFRLYHERNTTLKTTILRRRRARYEEFWALRDVTLEVPAGTTFGLVGHNGSGKSTLLKCMARILSADEGSVTVDGKVSALLELGAGFHPELSGRENVFLNGSILGMSQRDIRRKLDDIVGFAGLERFIDTPVKNYSSGMYLRLGFSVAINVEPDVLLVDEVLAVGDTEFQRRCGEKVATLKEEGRTIVVVSHGLDALRTLCDEVAWLEHGRVREVGKAGVVIDRYLDEVHVEGDGPGDGRWGSGEVTVTDVQMLDGTGLPVDQARTGDAVTFRLHYTASAPIERPVFGIMVANIEGVHVSAPNLRDGEMALDRISGSGYLDYQVPRLPLLPGTYVIGTTLEDYNRLHMYDARTQALRFEVDPGSPRDSTEGFVAFGGTWSHDGPTG